MTPFVLSLIGIITAELLTVLHLAALLHARHDLHPRQMSLGSIQFEVCAVQQISMFKTSLGVAEARSSLKGCSEMSLKFIPARLCQTLMTGVCD